MGSQTFDLHVQFIIVVNAFAHVCACVCACVRAHAIAGL